jgi:hypothetical protein
MEAAKQEIEQTGGVRCLGRQSESRDGGEHKRGTAFQCFTATQRHGNTPRLNRFQTTIQLDNRADGRFVPRISRKYRKSLLFCGKPTACPALSCGYGKESVKVGGRLL